MASPFRSDVNHLRTLFEYAPISLWEEDYSAIHQTFEKQRAAGVTDLRA